jgi:hypothetical protein
VPLSFTSDQPDTMFDFRVDGGAWTLGGTSPLTLTELGNGSHLVEVRGSTTTGGTGAVVSGTVVVTLTPPLVSFVDPPLETVYDTVVTAAFTSDAPAASFTCSVDGASQTPCTSPVTLTGLALGTHTLTVVATDSLRGSGAATMTFNTDLVAPGDLLILSGPPASSSDPTATFTFVAAPGLTFECSLDGQFTPCTSGVTFTGLTPGSYTFRVRTVDADGHRSAVFNWQWKVA